MAHQCTICYQDFAFDTSVQDKSFLPVQSRACSHVLCCACVVAICRNSGSGGASPNDKKRNNNNSRNDFDDDDLTIDDFTINDEHEHQHASIPCPECRMPQAHSVLVSLDAGDGVLSASLPPSREQH